jgi:hypothetical protein
MLTPITTTTLVAKAMVSPRRVSRGSPPKPKSEPRDRGISSRPLSGSFDPIERDAPEDPACDYRGDKPGAEDVTGEAGQGKMKRKKDYPNENQNKILPAQAPHVSSVISHNPKSPLVQQKVRAGRR